MNLPFRVSRIRTRVLKSGVCHPKILVPAHVYGAMNHTRERERGRPVADCDYDTGPDDVLLSSLSVTGTAQSLDPLPGPYSNNEEME